MKHRISFSATALSLVCFAGVIRAQPPGILVQPTNQSALAGGGAALAVAVSGPGPFNFQWQFNGTNLPAIIERVAGEYVYGFSGDGGAATSAVMNAPVSVAVDGAGQLFIADFNNQRVRKVDTNGIMTTFAGNGVGGYSGDGGAATNAGLDAPSGVAMDGLGNIYIADRFSHRVRKVNSKGIITSVAGVGTAGFSGDGGAATNAALNGPSGVAVDAWGNLFIADFNNRVRKVDTNGVITTIAGTGTQGYSGDGGAATNAEISFGALSGLAGTLGVTADSYGNLFIADNGNSRIRKVDTNGVITTIAGNGTTGYSGDGGPATNAALRNPTGVAVDGFGNIYIADTQGARVRKAGANGVITTLVGNGVNLTRGDGGAATNAQIDNPCGLATDGLGNLFVADFYADAIREVTDHGPIFSILNASVTNAGSYAVVVSNLYGSVTSSVASLTVNYPPAISASPTNQAVVLGQNAALTVSASGTSPLSYQWYFDGAALAGRTNAILNLVDAGAANAGNYVVVAASPYGSATSAVAMVKVGLPPAIATQPSNQTATLGGVVTLNTTVSGTGPLAYQWQCNGTNLLTTIKTVAGTGAAGFSGDGGPASNAAINNPSDVTVDGVGNVYIADSKNHRIRVFQTNGVITTVAGSGTGGYSGDGGPATNAELNLPYCAVLDASGNLYIADRFNSRIRLVDTNGVITTIAGNGTNGFGGDGGTATNAAMYWPTYLALDAFGNLFFSDTQNNRVRKVDTHGIVSTVAGNGVKGYSGDRGAATNAVLNNPAGLALDQSGNLYVSDLLNQIIRKIDSSGIITTVAGTPQFPQYPEDGVAATNSTLHNPTGLAFDGLGDLLIADQVNEEIRSVAPNGIISTVAGIFVPGFSGDGGAATNAQMSAPYGMAVDAAENLFIADYGNNRIREVAAFGPSLTLENLTAANAGNYVLVVSSPYGSVTSAVATLTLSQPPLLTLRTPVISGQSLVLGFNAANTPGTSFTLLQSPALSGPWTTNSAAVVSTNAMSGGYQFTLPTPGSTEFYQLRSP